MPVAIRAITRLNMSPATTVNDLVDIRLADTVLSGKLRLGYVSTGIPFSDSDDFFRSDNGLSVTFSAGLPVFANRIAHVFGVSSKPQVSRIHTSRIVASVTDFKVILDRAIGKLVGYAMGITAFSFSGSMKITVSLAIKKASPYPATIKPSRFVNLCPKAVGKINNRRVVTMKETHWLTLDPTAAFATIRNNLGLFPAPTEAVTSRNFLRRLGRGILVHVSSSFQAIGLAAGCFNIAAASYCLDYNIKTRSMQPCR